MGMTTNDFHATLQLLINAIEEEEISYAQYTERYVALLEQFERED